MKVKHQIGIKSFSGEIDGLIYANYLNRGVVVGKMPSAPRKATEQNVKIGNRSRLISTIYKGVSAGYKKDLELYTLKLYNQVDYYGKISGNKYSTFCKLIWKAASDEVNPLDLERLAADGLTLGQADQISTVKVAVENGYLPQVEGYDELIAKIGES